MAAAHTTNRHSFRDSKGRFAVRTHHVDEMTTEGMPFHNDEAGVAHSHARCTQRCGATQAVATLAEAGWLCGRCIDVATAYDALLAYEAEIIEAGSTVNVARTHGTATCACCAQERKVTSFPTMRDAGYMVRDLRECRVCRDERRAAAAARQEAQEAQALASSAALRVSMAHAA